MEINIVGEKTRRGAAGLAATTKGRARVIPNKKKNFAVGIQDFSLEEYSEETPREKWIAALRSGYYKQGTGSLRSLDNSFCCLGVALDTLDPNGWSEDSFRMAYAYKHGQTAILNSDYREIFGITLEQEAELTIMNDSQGKSFGQIADYLETL